MVKEKRILSYFIGWLFLGFIISFIGINKIFALNTNEYENITYLNNYTVFYVKADYASSPLQLQPVNEYQLEEVTGFLVNIDNYTFNAGVTYNIEIEMPLNTLTNANRYTVTGDNNMTCSVTQIDNTTPNFPNFTFNCPNTTRSLTLNIFNSDGNYIVNNGLFRWNYTYLRKKIATLDLGILENQQAQIIDQNNQIIQGQDEINDNIKEQFNYCRPSNNILNFSNLNTTYNGLNVIRKDGIVTLSGTATNAGSIDLGTYTLEPGTYYQNANGTSGHVAYSVITSQKDNTILLAGNGAFTLSQTTLVRMGIFFNANFNGTYIFKPMLNKGTEALNWEIGGIEICQNRIDETNDKLDETNQNLNDIEGALTDDSPSDMSGLGNSAGWLPAGPVDSILTLPLTLFTTLSDNLSNNTCTTVVLNLPFVNKNINLPCIKTLYDKIGITGTLFTTAGIIASCFILFNYLLSLYNWVDNTLTMRENTMPGYYDDNWGGGA